MKLKLAFTALCLMSLQACSTSEPVVERPQITFDEPPLVKAQKRFQADPEELYSNESVIYYPLDKPAGDVKQKFPEYRSVLENTTAGGYTVFDPSVTVYAVEDGETKPSYLPEYSVPQYAEQYATNMRLEEKRQEAAIPPLPPMPVATSPRMLTMPDAPEQSPVAVDNTVVAKPLTVRSDAGRRSRPPRMLTSYD